MKQKRMTPHLRHINRQQKDRPEDAISRYNLGTALYKKKQFEKASDEFRRSLDAADPIYRAQGYYNLGNAQVQLNDIQGAIRSYKSALRLNPADLDAKHNLELALERLEQQSQQNRSESGDEGKDQREQDQQQQNQDQQDRDKQEPNQQDQENPSEIRPTATESGIIRTGSRIRRIVSAIRTRVNTAAD